MLSGLNRTCSTVIDRRLFAGLRSRLLPRHRWDGALTLGPWDGKAAIFITFTVSPDRTA